MSNYWQITLWDKQTIRVKPDNVGFIKDKLERGEGHIITPTRTIAVKDIKSFDETDVPEPVAEIGSGPTDLSLLEQAAQAFKEPLISSEGAVVKAVKKFVPQRKWDSYYSHIPAYKKLDEQEGRVLMGFYVAVEHINPYTTEPCSPEEIARIT